MPTAPSTIRTLGNIFVVVLLGWVGARLAAPEVPSDLVFGLTALIATTSGLLAVCVHQPTNVWAVAAGLLAAHLLAVALFPWAGGTPWAALELTDTWRQARHCGAMALLVSMPFMPYALATPGSGEVLWRLALRTVACGAAIALLAIELHCALPAMEYRWLGHASVPMLVGMAISLETRRPWRSHVVFYAGLATVMALSFYLSRYLTQQETSVAAVKTPAQKEALHATLTTEQYTCTQENGTETPFHNAYWDNHADGIYVDVVSGEPLFSSLDKYDSGTGWPSFSHPLEDNVVERRDASLGTVRTEVRSRQGDSHLGHVFDDGPGPSGQRFCINSASLRFVPLEALHAQRLDRYLFLFADKKGWDIATLAGGCFWGMQEILSQRPGVITSQVGYTGGVLANPTYEDVCSGTTGHAESLQILFDPKKASYESLLLFFFRMHDPTTKNRQVNDVGTQYRSAIFYRNEGQKRVAEAVKAQVDASGAWKRPVVTEIDPLGAFWRAEESHQDYLNKHPFGYTCHEVRDLDFTVKP